MQGSSARPMGVTILAVLAAIGGVFGILGGLALIGLGGLAAGVVGGGLAGLAFLFGLITLVLAVLSLAFAYGAWTLKPWAWMLGIGIEAASIVLAAINVIGGASPTSQIIGVAIAAIIIYYLMTPDVKRAFGRA